MSFEFKMIPTFESFTGQAPALLSGGTTEKLAMAVYDDIKEVIDDEEIVVEKDQGWSFVTYLLSGLPNKEDEKIRAIEIIMSQPDYKRTMNKFFSRFVIDLNDHLDAVKRIASRRAKYSKARKGL